MLKSEFMSALVRVIDRSLPDSADEERMLVITADKVLHILNGLRNQKQEDGNEY